MKLQETFPYCAQQVQQLRQLVARGEGATLEFKLVVLVLANVLRIVPAEHEDRYVLAF